MRLQDVQPAHEHDTPRDAMSLLTRRVTLATVSLLVAFAAGAWWLVAGQARDMAAMVSGFAQVGRRMPNDASGLLFIGMWVTMMVAMMFPTIAPVVLVHRMVVRKRGEGSLPTVAFVGGYLVVWAAIGLIPLAAFLGFRALSGDAGESRWLPTLGGIVLAGAGAYQFTRWKMLCLRACRSPLGFLMTHDFRTGARGAFRAGISHGLYCLGCCWALMAVLVVVGLMNLVWMAAVAIVFLAEKNWRRGVGLTKGVGTALVAFGLAAVIWPGILGRVSETGTFPPGSGERMGQMQQEPHDPAPPDDGMTP